MPPIFIAYLSTFFIDLINLSDSSKEIFLDIFLGFIFAKKRTIVWDNDINPMTRKESKISSKWSRSQVIEKLTELGFYDGESIYLSLIHI